MVTGGVRKVTRVQTMVEPITLITTWEAKGNVGPPHRGDMPSTTPIADEAAIAAISLHALTRHQNQRARYTSPIPAPSVRSSRKSWEIDVAKNEIAMPMASATIEAIRPAAT